MEKYTQFSIFLVNKPGVLSQVLHDLAKAKVNVVTLAMMDSTEHGVLRMVVDAAAAAREVLKNSKVPITETDVLCVPLSNRPGAAADLCDQLASAHINIAYMYCTGTARGGKTMVILKVPDIKKAVKVLEAPKGGRKDMKVKLRRPRATTKR